MHNRNARFAFMMVTCVDASCLCLLLCISSEMSSSSSSSSLSSSSSSSSPSSGKVKLKDIKHHRRGISHEPIKAALWLPLDHVQLATNLDEYQAFDKLCHATHVSTAVSIVQNGIQRREVGGECSLNNTNVNVVFVAPDCATGAERYGPVTFKLNVWGNEVTCTCICACKYAFSECVDEFHCCCRA
jgi:hypothetical protein